MFSDFSDMPLILSQINKRLTNIEKQLSILINNNDNPLNKALTSEFTYEIDTDNGDCEQYTGITHQDLDRELDEYLRTTNPTNFENKVETLVVNAFKEIMSSAHDELNSSINQAPNDPAIKFFGNILSMITKELSQKQSSA